MADSTDDHGHGNTEYTTHRPGAVRRTISKIKNTAGLALHDPKPMYVNYHDRRAHPHPKVEGVVNTVGFTLIQDFMQYLKGPDGEAAMECILSAQGKAAARLALTDEVRTASRVVAQEVVSGSCDGLRRKGREAYEAVHPLARGLGVFGATCYGALLATGLLASLWRFALFGLH